MQQRQNEIVDAHRPAAADLEKRGIHVAIGEARFTDPHVVEVNGHPLGAERFVIAAGSQPVIPEVPGRELLITSDQLLFLPEFPPSLTFIGAGPVALELAGAFNDFGTRVTVLARDAEILPRLRRGRGPEPAQAHGGARGDVPAPDRRDRPRPGRRTACASPSTARGWPTR